MKCRAMIQKKEYSFRQRIYKKESEPLNLRRYLTNAVSLVSATQITERERGSQFFVNPRTIYGMIEPL